MLKFLWLALVFSTVETASAQEKVYRCGNQYTNMLPASDAASCVLLNQGNVTVLPAFKAPPTPAPQPALAAVGGSDSQRSKDADARFILDGELKKAQARQSDLLKEFNNGEPEKLGSESRNHQKYLDRVQEMKANIQRNEADIASIRREIGRLSGVSAR
jgi:hypothetical protein